MNGNNELKRRRTQSFSPEKKATRIPVPKSVLYPALLDYIRSKVPKATSATENAPAFKEGSNEAKQQFPTRLALPGIQEWGLFESACLMAIFFGI